MSISFLIPSRQREVLLKKTIESIILNSSNTIEYDILIRIDEDDMHNYENFVNWIIESEYWTKIKILVGPRYYYSNLNEYYNELGRFSNKKWLFIFNDDSAIATQNWDKILQSELNDFALLNTKDDYNLKNNGTDICFPIVPRSIIDALGFVSSCQGIDTFLQVLFSYFHLTKNVDILIKHDRYDLTGNNYDSTYLERNLFNPPSYDRAMSHIEKLQNFIDKNGLKIF